jgi:GrpB-like predicted nucleotidyltransferase (UPF0157 family)
MDYLQYDPAYPQVFTHLTQSIHSVLPGATVEIVGGTSVHGLGGREALDCVSLSEPRDRVTILAGHDKSPLTSSCTAEGYACGLPVLRVSELGGLHDEQTARC